MAEQQRVALIFAVDEYDHPDLQRLSAPLADANALAETLGRPELGNFSVEVSHNATSAAAAEKLEDFLIERKSGDLAVLHFSGHGLKDESGGLYLAARNTVPTRLASTAIDTTLINLLMRRSRARSIVLLLDCCYGGAFERGMTARAAGMVAVRDQFSLETLGGGRGRVVITASSAVQYAFEGTRLADRSDVIGPSLFTGAIVGGIRTGEADRDADGFISLSELYDHVYEKVLEQSPHQTPSKWEYGLQGDLIIAKSPQRAVHPAALPDPLVEAVQHAYPVVRRGAVEELARLANGNDLPMALAALQTLQELRDDDSRSVATAAAAAVGALTMTASVSTLAFGEVGPDRVDAELTCELLGPPLVQTATISEQPVGFTAALDGRIIRVRMDLGFPRERAGTIHVRSALGELQLAVSGTVCETVALETSDTTTHLPDDRQPAVTSTQSPDEKATDQTPPPVDPATHPTRRRLGPTVGAAGGVLLGIALFVPWATGTFTDQGLWYYTPVPSFAWLLPCMIVLLSVGALVMGRWEATATGGMLGGALIALELLILIGVIVATRPDSTWQPGGLVQLVGGLLAITGGVIAARSSPQLTAPVRARVDRHSVIGLAIVLAGVVYAVAEPAGQTTAEPWNFVFPLALAVVALPIPILRLNGAQRRAVLSMVITFVLPWLAVAPWSIAAGAYPWVGTSDWWIICLPPVVAVIGCLIGQRPRTARPTTAAQQTGRMSDG